ncbi:hypothetical protein HanIR_Chr06g0287141 [Helianthus annuus]|nr:hypothetical protein HanIR_Chr06g0287141 [Helianthus annuus]
MTRGMGAPPTAWYVSAGYGGAWVGLGLGAPRGRVVYKKKYTKFKKITQTFIKKKTYNFIIYKIT